MYNSIRYFPYALYMYLRAQLEKIYTYMYVNNTGYVPLGGEILIYITMIIM